ncbi:hypothetical protein [Turicimonas muris]|uniref:hypothetical protein n=1 Tax=Turicimonas muris TaxID=1796652 RepID=UPI00248BB4D3|nr:hypothetical protein [Turicimonas muris]
MKKEIETVPYIDSQEILDFLNSVNNSRCPWCGNNQWNAVMSSKSLSKEKLSLEAAQTVYIETEKEKDVDTIEFVVNPEPPSVYMKLRCKVCGCELRFDYTSLLQKVKEKKNGTKE